ncbi:MAG: hypothetical protein H0W48_03555 [Methylibium sp.]|nr:hypothetical protein [Methylibium sp.]
MSLPDKLLSRIGTSQKGVDEAYRQRRSDCVGVWGTKIVVVISLTAPFGLMAGALLVSLWKRRGQPAVVEPA